MPEILKLKFLKSMVWISAQRKLVAKCLAFVFNFRQREISWFRLNIAGLELKMFTKYTDFYEPLMFLNDNLVSRSTKSYMTQNDLPSKDDTQESLHDTEDTAPSKKAIKKFDACKSTLTNDLNEEPKNTLKNLDKVKTRHSSSKTADDMFCKTIAVDLKLWMRELPKIFWNLIFIVLSLCCHSLQ